VFSKSQYIYHLSNPITKEIKYIGITDTPRKRFYAHLKNKQHTWISELITDGFYPIMTVFDRCALYSSECECYIVHQCIKLKIPITNTIMSVGVARENETTIQSFEKFTESVREYDNMKTHYTYFKFLSPLKKSIIDEGNIIILLFNDAEMELLDKLSRKKKTHVTELLRRYFSDAMRNELNF